MTKIKNTKKGMAKKTLSMSLVVAMLATSNVPVWAAEFSDGTDAAAFTSEAEAPVVDDAADVITDSATAATASIAVNGATDNKISVNAAKTMTVNTNWEVTAGERACINVFAPKSDNSGKVNVGDENNIVLQNFEEGYSEIKNSGSLDGTTVNWANINPADYIGKTLYVAVTETSTANSGKWEVKVVIPVTITAASAQDYVKSTFSKTVEWGTVLSGTSYASGATLATDVVATGYKWVCQSTEQADGYKTISSDVSKTYELKATLKKGDTSLGEATLGTVAIKAQNTVGVKSVVWEDGVKVNSYGEIYYTYDGTAHYPKLKSVTLDNGVVIDVTKTDAVYYKDIDQNGNKVALTVDDVTEAGGVDYKVSFETAEYGEITYETYLNIIPVDLTTDATLAVTKGFEYDKSGIYAADTEEKVSKAGISVTTKAGKTLTWNTDYKIVSVLASPVNAVGNNALVTIEGTGNYDGTLTIQAPITACELKDDDVTVDATGIVYDGNAKTPAVTVKGGTLVKGTDYTVSYSDNTQVGDATVTVTGIGNYTGTVKKTFKIESASLDDLATELDASVFSKTYTYTGKSIEPIGDAYLNMRYIKNRDFTVEYNPQNVNAGQVRATVKGINNYKDAKQKEFTFTIQPRSLKDNDVKVELKGLTYSTDITDTQVKNAVTITYNGMTLIENTDYTITKIDKSVKGKVTFDIVGKDGNYTGRRTETLSLTAKNINDVTLPKIDAQKYTGSEFTVANGKLISNGDTKADFVIKDGTTGLKEGSDYKIVNYENNKNVGTATINIVGTGAYTGTASISFPIVANELTGSIVYNGSPLIPDQQYSYAKVNKFGGYTFDFTDTALTSDNKLRVVKQDGTVIPTSQYTVTYENNTAAGTATITVKGVEGYNLYAVNTFKIVPAKLYDTNSTVSISKFELKDSTAKHYYTGEEIKPEMTVEATDGTYKLVEGTDYKIEYSDNTDVTTTAKVKLVGLGNYAGTVAEADVTTPHKLLANFAIAKTAIRPTDIVAADVAYAGGITVTPSITIKNQYTNKVLVEGTDYTVELKEGGVNAGQAKAVVKLTTAAYKNYGFAPTDGKNDQEYTVTFNVTAQDLANVTVSSIEDQIVTGEQIKPAITVMNGSVKLVEGTDYEVSYGDNKEVGEGTVTIKALDSSKNYTGSQTVKFNIVEKAAEVGQAMIADVKVSGNTVTPILSGDVDGAVGYDYVLATEENTTDGRIDISKNVLSTHTNFYYVPEGTYYVYCHAWKRGEDGKKVFGEWSNIKEVKVEATTPSTPTITSVKVKGSTVTVTYTESENATGYDVVLGTSVKKVNGERRPVEYGKLVKKNVEEGTVEVTFTNVPSGTYYAGLHAYNRTSANASKVFSKWSNHKTVRVK